MLVNKLVFEWLPFPRGEKSVRIPYGWKIDPYDTTQYLPDHSMVPAIEQALIQIDNGVSLRDAAAWLTEKTGKPISHMGLRNIWHKVVVNKDETLRKERLDTWRKPKTRAEKKARKIVEQKSQARRAITIAKRKLAKLNGDETNGGNSDGSGEHLDVLSDAFSEEQDIIFKPNEGPQTEFLEASEQEVLYGGAAGGGKSFALLADPVRYFDHPKFNGLLIRRTNEELRDLINESLTLYKRAYPEAVFNKNESTWRFPSGARLWMSYLDRDTDVHRYQGQAFTWIGVDELTHYATPYAWNYLRSRLRTTAKDLPLCMRATTNPGGPGHGWVKRMFIDPAPPGKRFVARDEHNTPMTFPMDHPKAGQPLFLRKFIPAKLKDNPYFSDGQYEASLLSLPENERRRLLDGDWNVPSGAAFPEFRTSVHTTDPFEIPSGWRRFRSCDFGYSSHSAVLWFAIDPDNRLYVYRELYVSKKNARELGRMIVDIERSAGEHMYYGVLDSSTFHQRGNSGPTIAEELRSEGARFRPSDRGHGSRVAGRNRLHQLLKVDETGEPGLIIFNTCRQLISDLEVIPTDPKGGDDIDDKFVSDHTYDALRYGIMSRPQPDLSEMDPWGDAKPSMAHSDPRAHMSDTTFGY